jgi:hypothetical protein
MVLLNNIFPLAAETTGCKFSIACKNSTGAALMNKIAFDD